MQLLDKVDASIRKQPTVRGNYEQILGRSLESLVNRAEELKTKWQVGRLIIRNDYSRLVHYKWG